MQVMHHHSQFQRIETFAGTSLRLCSFSRLKAALSCNHTDASTFSSHLAKSSIENESELAQLCKAIIVLCCAQNVLTAFPFTR
jgi:hypothetical protein